MYCRFESGVHPRENVVDIVCTLKDHIESLDDHRQLLETVWTTHTQLLETVWTTHTAIETLDHRQLLETVWTTHTHSYRDTGRPHTQLLETVLKKVK